MRRIEYFKNSIGEEPCRIWLHELDSSVQPRVWAYIQRTAYGAAKKNIRSVGDGVFEIKIDHGPGYRVYFGEVGTQMVLLLMGGHKGSQFRDIQRAKEYWRDYVSK